KMDIIKLYKVINDDLEEEAIKKFDSREQYIKWSQNFYEKYGYKSYGLRVPEIENIVKKYVNQFIGLSLQERFDLSRRFYKSEYIAQTHFGLKLLEISIPELKPQNFEFLDELLNYITNWGPTDSFSLYIMQSLLRKYPNETKQLIKKWNISDHIWKKRASVVTFTRKIGLEGEYVIFLLELCDNLIWDKEDLVRKAVGWALKDNMFGKNKEKVLNYVKKLRKMGVSSTITLYAIRKLKGKERDIILNIRPPK
ncbi:MAG: DNA alkylation repair protein, partial [Promethearchaeota archaeon]